MAQKYIPAITMISTAGYLTEAGVPVMFHAFSLQHNTTLQSIYFRNGSTGSFLGHTPVPSKARTSGSDDKSFPEGESPYYDQGIYASFGGAKLCSVCYELTD